MSFRAVVVDQSIESGRITSHWGGPAELDDERLGDASVTVDVAFSDLNYKDALALLGYPGVLRRTPLIPGIDLVGTVAESEDPRWHPGQLVVLTGDGLGETRDGGFATRSRVGGDALVAVPPALTARQAAAIGTAGFTAMLSVLRLEQLGVTAGAGDVLVTGATGGVGSIAVAVLARLGHQVVASTGRVAEQGDYLRSLGAAEVIDRAELGEPGAPLQRRRWAAAVDSVGSTTLANVLAQTADGGAVTACGLTQGSDLPATVMPFILRGVTLAGINSVTAAPALRRAAWERLASDLDLGVLDGMTHTIGIDDLFTAAKQLHAGRLHGRTVVDVRA